MTDAQELFVEEEFRKQGYSKESLNMLESEEGQRNAIFACYGSAAQHGQLFEESLSKLIVTLNEWSGSDIPVEKRTFGQLWWEFKGEFVKKIDDWVPEYLKELKENRNFMIHQYFLERSDDFGTEPGRMAILKELLAIEERLRRGTSLINGLRTAIEETLAGQRPDGTVDDRMVFSVELDIETTKRRRADTAVRVRIDSDTKARATEVLQAMGLSVSDAIRLLLLHVADEERLPFDVRVPNAETVKAMKELEAGKGKRFNSAEELFRDLRA